MNELIASYVCDPALENRAHVHIKFDYFGNLKFYNLLHKHSLHEAFVTGEVNNVKLNQ